jgi:flagellar basal-body rod protein FlgC
LVRVKNIGFDDSPFVVEQDPGNPAADENGFVKRPNVNILVELADMREANRTYEANLQVAKQSSDLMNQTVALLKEV